MNVEPVNNSIIDYETEAVFDAILCTFALEIIPDYKAAIDKMFDLLRPGGKIALIGMKLSSRTPNNLLNPLFRWIYRMGQIDVDLDIVAYVASKSDGSYYEECFLGFYYILIASKSGAR